MATFACCVTGPFKTKILIGMLLIKAECWVGLRQELVVRRGRVPFHLVFSQKHFHVGGVVQISAVTCA